VLQLARHHLVLSWLVLVAVQLPIGFCRRVLKAGSMDLRHLGTARRQVPAVGSIPQIALTELDRLGLRPYGFSSLGVLTSVPLHGSYAFSEAWVDDETHSILCQGVTPPAPPPPSSAISSPPPAWAR
jgi:hypothetical protein